MAKPKPRDGSTLEGIIIHHENQLEYYKKKNKEFRNMPIWAKVGQSKTIYVPEVLKYRQKIKFHTQAINTLKEVMNNERIPKATESTT